MDLFASALILLKFDVKYFRCTSCRFIQTEVPYWLDEAYSEAISSLDVGIMQRNLHNSDVTAAVISLLFPTATQFLDYAGGHGTLVRMMRDRGFDFRWCDLYAKNLHARGFEHVAGTRYDVVTAYEVLEHLVDPLKDIARMLTLTDNLLMTTEILPEPVPVPPHWWYYSVNGGQHISFYSQESLQRVAAHFGMHLLSKGGYHLFTRSPKSGLLLRLATSCKVAPAINRWRVRESLTLSDLRKMS
jgi:hypothetical protein